MNTMLLKQSDIQKIISMQDVIDIVDKTFVDLGEGKTLNPTKLNLNLGDSEPTNLPYKASLNAMPAYIAWQDMAGQKWAGGWGKGRREIGRPFINALIMLVHPNYGDFLAVMDGAWITNMRTGAQTAVILRYLLKDKKDITVGLYGAGVQGRTQTEALTTIFNVQKLYVYDPVPAAAAKFKEEMKDKVQGEIILVDHPEKAAKADAVITVSQRGTTAQMVSRFRPATTVVACLLDEQVRRQMSLYFGVVPLMMPYASNTDELVDFAVDAAEKAGLVKQGDLVVVTAGVPVGVAGTTNMIRVHLVGGFLLNGVGIGTKNASGPLCVCRSQEEVAAKFHPGDVLVVPYTTNDLLGYIRQAAAVISEESGGNSHAATVGLTLDKAVIVGATGATQRLQDGTMVAVDCVRGVVQTLPQ